MSTRFLEITPRQLRAYRSLQARWRGRVTPIGPYRLTPDARVPKGSYIGVWVGEPRMQACPRCGGDGFMRERDYDGAREVDCYRCDGTGEIQRQPGLMFIGIEPDGYTHS